MIDDPEALDLTDLKNAVLLSVASVPIGLLPPALADPEPAGDAAEGFAIELVDLPSHAQRLAEIARDELGSAVEHVARSFSYLLRQQVVSVSVPEGLLTGAQVEMSIRTGTALIYAKMLATSYGARLECDREGRAALLKAAQTGNLSQIRVAVAEHLVPTRDYAERPRALVLIPLHLVPPDEHPTLIDTAALVCSSLQATGYAVSGPDPALTPDTVIEVADPLTRCELEREQILRADVVVAVLAGYDSYGASRAVSWVEGNGASALILAHDDNLPVTRVLNGMPTRTTQASMSIADVDGLCADVRRWAARQLTLANEHARQTEHITRELDERLSALREQLSSMSTSERDGLTPAERLGSMLSTPLAFVNASLREHMSVARGIRLSTMSLLRDLVDAEIGQLMPLSMKNASDGPARRIQSPRVVDPPTTIETPYRALDSVLRPKQYGALRAAAADYGWDDSEVVRLLDAYMASASTPGHPQRNTPTEPRDWKLFRRTHRKPE